MQPKKSPLILATAGLGVLALGGLAFVLTQSGSGPAPSPVQAAPTPTPAAEMRWVANRDIPPRTRVEPYMLRQIALAGDAPADGIKNPTELRGTITNRPILRGENISLTSFTPGLQRVVPANIEIPAGSRAVAIYVDPSSTAAGLVDVGDRVDVIAVHRLNLEKGKEQIIEGAVQFSAGRLVGSNLRVLAVDKSLDAPVPTPTPSASPAPGVNVEGGPPPTPTPPPPPATQAPTKTRVLLAAPVEIATRLVAAGDQGTLHITIRNPADGDQTQSKEAREYPSRLVTQKEVNSSARQIGKAYGDGVVESLSKVRRPPVEQIPFPPQGGNMGGSTPATFGTVPTLPPPAQPTPRPAAPTVRDITVIRGTEKTRVIVPIR